ncbi:hypothetical protein BD410DRAFT_820404 [Rickenella mellea]|uniref:VanZ-like domain-containing protein n=1 Tax=Rickenella mellea TaxID=50990 RepID=A0A4Y7Q9B0_9AGAM|nr:hypothetical protein BD410DRAFT_820404 [Rickenella mellea]
MLGLENARKLLKKASKAIMRSYKLNVPKYDLPIRLRPWFLLFTAFIMLLLAFLGFTNFANALPLNDKILHLVCLGLATGVFYFIFDVEEEARRIWFWRHSGLILTAVTCMFFGGIVSEFVQSLLPYKEFQIGDVVANLLGSGIGLYVAYYLERYYRHRREISRLYRPISLDPDDPPESDEDEDAQMLLPLHHGGQPPSPATGNKATKDGRVRLGDVWNDSEELFGIGDSDEEDNTPKSAAGPKIIVTSHNVEQSD